MKRKWHIKNHLLASLVGLTTALLLTVALAFNLSLYGYIRSRVATQLFHVSQSASEERRDDGPASDRAPNMGGPDMAVTNTDGQHAEQQNAAVQRPFDEHKDRVMGTRGSAVLLNSDGTLFDNLHGDQTVAEKLSDWYRVHAGDGDIENKVIFLDNGTFVVSASDDPVTQGQILLTYVDVTSIMAFAQQINYVLLLVILAAVLISIFVSRRFARSLSEPVRSLSEFAAEIGGGNLEPQDLNLRDVEFDALAASMNRMASDLRDAKQKQDVFFQNVSHELRTPLTSIRGNAEGVVYGLMEPQQAAKVILAESDKLSTLVEDILFLSRAGKERTDGAKELLDLREIISLCVSEQRAEAEKKGVAFSFDFDDAPVTMHLREQDAERMIGNLLSNAIRYAANTVQLCCHNETDAVVFSVKDDGPGVAAEDLPHVFERMYKGKGGKHGIGLAIAQAVAQSCGGEILVRNDAGAVFEARFPLAQTEEGTKAV